MVGTATTQAGPDQRLVDWLASQGVDFEIHEHRLSYSARETARAEGVDARTFAKVVGITSQDGRTALIVLDAVDHLDMHKLREVLEAPHVRLLTEAELTELSPSCEAGALPAIGQLFGLPMYADYAVREDPEISFNAGSHRFSVRVDRVGWERATGVIYADLATDLDWRPAWSRS
jgi:Ala-tRNA(Pro) deacylase